MKYLQLLINLSCLVQVYSISVGQHKQKTCSESGRSIPPMLSVLNIESYLHRILVSLHKEIIEHSYSLWFPRERTPFVILHTLHPTEAIFESNGIK